MGQLRGTRRFGGLIVVAAVACAGVIAAVGLGQVPGKSAYEIADLRALEDAFIDLADKVRPSVMAVRTYRTATDNEERPITIPVSHGSGVVVGSDGYILTNNHVLDDANLIAVVDNTGVQHEATIVEADPRSDLAVLKIPADGLTEVKWGDVDSLRVNQWAFACGNPFGLGNLDGNVSVTYGVVSALGRQLTHRLARDGVEYYGNLIETSCAINPGSSGGGLFNLSGELIGIVTAIETTSGVNEGHGFAIPVDRPVRRVIDSLKSGQRIRYGYMGVRVSDVPQSALVRTRERARGAMIDNVDLKNGPADLAGLKAGDIVVSFDGTPIQNSDHLVRLVGFTPAGTEATVVFRRNGAERTTRVKLADRLEAMGFGDE